MVSYCDKYVQIKLVSGSKFLDKALNYANKHFKEKYHLSSSILILDNGQSTKKDYFVNWSYHSSYELNANVLNDNILKNVLQNTHLPIRIKIVKEYALLEEVKIQVKVLANSRVLLILQKDSSVAKRYIRYIFDEYVVGSIANEVYLRSNDEEFWNRFMRFVNDKIIHNVVLKFEYNRFDDNHLTKEEAIIKKSCEILNSNFGDDFELIKKRYLELVKQYHPDRVHGKNQALILEYINKFRTINEAYKQIKSYFAMVS